MAPTALLQSFLALDFEDSGFVRKSRSKLVINDDNRVILDTTLGDQVCDASCVSECGDVSTDLVESKTKILGNSARKLALGLVTDNHDGGFRIDVYIVPSGKRGLDVV